MWELGCKESWAPKNWYFRIVEDSWESLDCKEIQPVHAKWNKSWIFIEGLMLKLKLQYFGHLMWTPWKRPWCWERSKAGREGDKRGWDCWMASPTQWTWAWAISGRWWRTGKPGVLPSMDSQRVRHAWVTEQQQQVLTWGNPVLSTDFEDLLKLACKFLYRKIVCKA